MKFTLDTRKLPKCPKCGREMYLRTYSTLRTHGLTREEITEVRKHYALLFKCDGDGSGGCGKNILICETGRIYEYGWTWKLIHEYIPIPEKVIFT